MLKERKFAILIAVPAIVLLRYVVFPNKGEFAHFAMVLKTYVAPLGIAVAILTLFGVLYAVYAKIDQERQRRAVNVWFWATSVFFGAVFTLAVLYAKLSPAPAS